MILFSWKWSWGPIENSGDWNYNLTRMKRKKKNITHIVLNRWIAFKYLIQLHTLNTHFEWNGALICERYARVLTFERAKSKDAL